MRYATFGEALRDQARGRGEDDREIRHHRVAVDVENEVQRHSVQLLENQSGCHVAVADEQVTGSQRAAAGKAALEVCDRGGLADSTGAVGGRTSPCAQTPCGGLPTALVPLVPLVLLSGERRKRGTQVLQPYAAEPDAAPCPVLVLTGDRDDKVAVEQVKGMVRGGR